MINSGESNSQVGNKVTKISTKELGSSKVEKGKVKLTKKIKECKEMIEITTMFGCHINLNNLDRACWYISSISEL